MSPKTNPLTMICPFGNEILKHSQQFITGKDCPSNFPSSAECCQQGGNLTLFHSKNISKRVQVEDNSKVKLFKKEI